MTDERSAEQASERLTRTGESPLGKLSRMDSAEPPSRERPPDAIRRPDSAEPPSCERPPDAITRPDSAEPPSCERPPDAITRMHSAEHLLTAVMRRLYGSPRNLEFHLGDKKTKCDYEVGRPFGPEDARSIEDAANAEIRRDHPVDVLQIARGDAQHLDLWKVPPNAETIRVVRIGDIDETPCSGEHVARTSEIGRFVLKSYEMRTPTVVRIRFGLEPD